MCPQPMKYKPGRGVKKSRKGQESVVYREPSYWEYGEGSQESQTTKRSCMKPTGSQPSNIPSQSQPSTASLRHLYLSQFPDFLHSYIDDIVDVGDDGNFCFGVIAALLGCVVESWSLIQS
ncbi:unnamed protein product [Lathyrus oleraceus]